jgi:hypothetical protein
VRTSWYDEATGRKRGGASEPAENAASPGSRPPSSRH